MSDPKFPAKGGVGRPVGKVPAKTVVPQAAKPAARPPVAPALVAKSPVKRPVVAPAPIVTPEPVSAAPVKTVVAEPSIETPVAVAATEQTSPPAPADAVTEAAPVTAATPPTEAAPAVAVEPEVVVPTQPDPVAAFETAPAIKKGLFTMATTFDAVTTPAAAAEKVQAMFGGLNDRAKTAMEKGTKLSEELTELTKGNVEAIVASSKLAAKGAEAMTQEAAEYSKKNFESATALFKSFAAVKSPTELFQLQSDYAKSSFDSVVAEASKLSEAWVKLAGEVVQPISNRYAVAAEKLKAAAL